MTKPHPPRKKRKTPVRKKLASLEHLHQLWANELREFRLSDIRKAWDKALAGIKIMECGLSRDSRSFNAFEFALLAQKPARKVRR